MKKKLASILLMLSALLIAGTAVSYLAGDNPVTGILLISGFIALALGVRGSEKLKGFSYTIWIFTAVIASMFYPQDFI